MDLKLVCKTEEEALDEELQWTSLVISNRKRKCIITVYGCDEKFVLKKKVSP